MNNDNQRKDVRMKGSADGTPGAEPSDYVDVKFESLLEDLDAHFRSYVSTYGGLEAGARVEGLNSVCRMVRSTKLHFHKVIDRYGTKCLNSATRLKDLAYAIADKANQVGDADLKESLARHAEEIDELCTALRERE